MKRALLGLAALIAVTLILFGWPWLLWRAATGPLSGFLPDLSNLGFALTHPDASGVLLGLVLLAAGAAWVVTAGALVVELLTQARGVSAPRLNCLALGVLVPQTSMSRLAATALFIIPVGATIAGPANAAALSPETAATAVSAHAVCDLDTRSGVGSHTVRPGETLWSVADEELGDGSRYPEVFRASKRLTQPDGGRLRDPDMIRPGWRLLIPATEDRASRGCPEPGTSASAAPKPAESAPDRPAADTASPSASGEGASKPSAASRAPSATPKLDRRPDLGLASGARPAQPSTALPEKARAGSDSAAPAALTRPEVRLAAVSSDRAELTWSQVPGANSYWVMVQGQSMQVPGTAVALRGLAASTEYRVEVRAMFPSGEWSKAAVLQIKTAPARAARPHSTARHSSLQALRHPGARGAAAAMPKLQAAESASPATRCLSQMRISLGILEEPLVGHVGHVGQRSEAGPSASERGLNGFGGLSHQRLTDRAVALSDLCPPHMKRNDLIDRATQMSRSWLPGTAAANIIRSGVTSVRT